MVYYSAWPLSCKPTLWSSPIVAQQKKSPVKASCRLPIQTTTYQSSLTIRGGDVCVNDEEDEWKETWKGEGKRTVKRINKNQAGMKRGEIYVGVHPCSAWLSSDWRETLAPLIQCLPRDNKSAWAQIEERQSLSCTVVSGPGVQRLLSQTLTYNVWFKKCNLTNIQRKCTVKGRQVIDPL